ncbi:MAG: hypothetical protein KDD44_00595 [Bdellovibrionales bacterium]|nr:hypothetical protein [Bdellovibrionales bacterium]
MNARVFTIVALLCLVTTLGCDGQSTTGQVSVKTLGTDVTVSGGTGQVDPKVAMFGMTEAQCDKYISMAQSALENPQKYADKHGVSVQAVLTYAAAQQDKYLAIKETIAGDKNNATAGDGRLSRGSPMSTARSG